VNRNRNLKYIDLSHPIEDSMPVYPGDETPRLAQDRCLEKDGYNNFHIATGMHMGTHIDSPMHMSHSAAFMGEYDVDQFCGRACLLDVRGMPVIEYRAEYDAMVREGDIPLLWTGWAHHYGSAGYYENHPVLDASMASFLVEKKVMLLGMDMPSPDRQPHEIHKFLFSQGICLLENLRNLEALEGGKNAEIFAFPLKIRADASMVRAVARYNEENS
jgi:kynurenine formamidase